jgi:hypothetical protein
VTTFQARHYVAVARLLHKRISEAREYYDNEALDCLTKIVTDFQHVFAEDSKGFDSVRFYDAAHTGKGI